MDILRQTRLKKIGELAQEELRQPEEVHNGIGLSNREIRSYSLLTAIGAKYNSIIRHTTFDGLEAECHKTLAQKYGEPISSGDILIPEEILHRDQSVGSASSGGYLVGSTTTGSFIETLRNRITIFRLGAQRLKGQVNQILLPKQTNLATATWLATEATAITEGNQVFAQIALTPKTVGAYTEVSRQLLLQSDPAVETVVMNDLAGILGVGLDAATINGTGASGEPLGILNVSGVGSVSGTSLGYAGLVEFQTDIANANAIINSDTLAYLTTPSVASTLKGRARFTNTDSPCWKGAVHEGEVEGVKALSTLQMPSATMLYGDFSQVLITEWGILTIQINPFQDFKNGIVGVRGLWSVDVCVRHAESFSVATSIT